jgi:hypothetical protein
MLTCNASNRFRTRILTGLAIGVTVVVGSLMHATANVQTFL